ncbi:MAG: hypothetical protein J2P31_18735, partial [Blastocatellia bacterium]|nr:hypothetical protein [Blastocatellia bacterium]
RLLTRWMNLTEAECARMSREALACFAKRYSMRGAAKAIHAIFKKAFIARDKGSTANHAAQVIPG